MYTALYRQYRPARFADVLGQPAIVAALQNQVKSGRVGHSYIFTGTRGTGKTTCAKLFARVINCENPHDGEPCGECEICRGIMDGSILDVSEIDAASNNGVDNVRALREETNYVPSVCRYRVYIIDEVHMLSSSAFNALLKVMEEPPAHVVFILATTEIHKVPATILSRCQRFDFNRIQPAVIAGLLTDVAGKAGIPLAADAAALLARLADGAARDALSLLDTCAGAAGDGPVTQAVVRSVAGVADKNYLFRVSDAVAQRDTAQALSALNGLLSASFEGKRLTEELLYHYRNLLLAGLGCGEDDLLEVDAGYYPRYRDSAAASGRELCVRAVERLGNALDGIGRGAAPRLQLELAVIDLCTPAIAPAPAVHQLPAAPAKAAAQAKNMAAPATPAPAKSTRPAEDVPGDEDAPPWNTDEPAPAPPPVKKPAQARPVAAQSTPVPAPAQGAAVAPVPLADGCTPVENWDAVVAALRSNMVVYSMMKETKGHFWKNKLLIEGSGTALDFIRNNKEATVYIHNALQTVLGRDYGIGPYPPAGEANAEKPKEAEPAGLKRLAEMGVPVVRE